jgi:protein TonB
MTHPARALERGYGRRIEIALLAAVLVHAAAFVVAPPYVARPYRLESAPLRLVASGGFGLEPSAGTAVSGALQPSAPLPAIAPAPAIVTEQVRVEPSGARLTPQAASTPERGNGAAGSGMGSGGTGLGEPGDGETDGDAPPVFYAFDSPPVVVSRAEPEYPIAARLAGAEGLVVLNANVNARGHVMRVWVARATAPEALVESAIDAMYRFRFTPGSQQGIPVPCTVAVPFNFRLNLRIEISGGKP